MMMSSFRFFRYFLFLGQRGPSKVCRVGTHWMKNLIPHPTSSPSSHFFRYFLFLGQRGPSKVCRVGTRSMWNLIPHPTSSPDRNLSKNTGRYVKNTNKKIVFFLFSSKINKYYFIILTIILLFSLGGPFQTSKFL